MIFLTRGRKIYYDLLGPDREPVVCMLASLSSDGGMWAEQVPVLLQHGFRVLRIDIPGHGGSTFDSSPVSFASLVNDVIEVLNFLNLPSVHFIGLSLGAMIGEHLAIVQQQRLKSAIFCSSSAVSFGDPRIRRANAEKALKERSLRPLVEPGMELRFSDQFKNAAPTRYAGLEQTLVGTDVDAYAACAAMLEAFDIRRELAGLTIPVLVIGGTEDRSTTPQLTAELAASIPSAQYILIKGARHLPNVECPDQFNATMVEWLEQNRA